MTDIRDLLSPDAIAEKLVVTSKKGLFQQLGGVAAQVYGVDAAAATASLALREKLGSTGFGGGVATPHGKLAGLDRVVAVVARLAHPLEFQAVDDVAVDIVLMLLSPPDAGADHLKALARVSRLLRDRAFVNKLRGAGSHDALYALLSADEARDAA
ncbi:MAG: PTS sugar transporter subunit IIA [Pseudomonadota bacterium]|nr:PTS sugar transporter subunit IIA [Pseudomonadota bacterium]